MTWYYLLSMKDVSLSTDYSPQLCHLFALTLHQVDVGHLKDVLMMDMLPSSIGVLSWDATPPKGDSNGQVTHEENALFQTRIVGYYCVTCNTWLHPDSVAGTPLLILSEINATLTVPYRTVLH